MHAYILPNRQCTRDHAMHMCMKTPHVNPVHDRIQNPCACSLHALVSASVCVSVCVCSCAYIYERSLTHKLATFPVCMNNTLDCRGRHAHVK